jgi:hypothetical protein
LAELIISKLKPLQEKRKKLLKNKKEILKILEAGAKKAQKIAKSNFKKIKSKVGLI